MWHSCQLYTQNSSAFPLVFLYHCNYFAVYNNNVQKWLLLHKKGSLSIIFWTVDYPGIRIIAYIHNIIAESYARSAAPILVLPTEVTAHQVTQTKGNNSYEISVIFL